MFSIIDTKCEYVYNSKHKRDGENGIEENSL